MGLGLVGGIGEDLEDKNLGRKISEANASFAPLKT